MSNQEKLDKAKADWDKANADWDKALADRIKANDDWIKAKADLRKADADWDKAVDRYQVIYSDLDLIKKQSRIRNMENRAQKITKSDYSPYCVGCGQEFSEDNPCWNDDGSWSDNDELHLNGECKNCANERLTRDECRCGLGYN